MTRQTFLRNLPKFINRAYFKVPGKEIRILGTNPGHVFCPITAMYYKKTGLYSPTSFYKKCGRTLGLNDLDIDFIVNAADNLSQSNVSIRRLRKAMMGRLGLTP